MTAPRSRRGTVVAFDEHAGHGRVRPDSDGGDDPGGDPGGLFFHCTAVAGGSRRIATGVVVAFEVVPGHLGRWEAGDVRPA